MMRKNGSESSTSSTSSAFEEEIINGLLSKPKTLPSKYFYDEKGDVLFQQIMSLPSYYLTDCEFEILTEQKKEILKPLLALGTQFQIVELGAGDGKKTKVLLRELDQIRADFVYMPVDISPHVLEQLDDALKLEIPNVKVQSIAATYEEALTNQKWDQQKPILMMFLGSNLGNFPMKNGQEFIQQISSALKPGDFFLIGLDLQKDPDVILDAYNDTTGVTKEFNMNLLDRINKELQGTFVRDKFKHFPIYDPLDGAAKSFLVSREQQQVMVSGNVIDFEQGEPIYMEISQKYKLSDIRELANRNGFKIHQNFMDKKKYFVDSLWEKL